MQFTLAGIRALIDENASETFNLEFKSGEMREDRNGTKLYSQIGEAVCAFANIEGGTIIVGIGENSEKQTRTNCEAPLKRDSKFNLQSLYRSLDQNINPRISKIDCYEVSFDEESYFLVVAVERSAFAPHQFKNKYFARRQIQNLPMIDAEVRDIRAGRIQTQPDILLTYDIFGNGATCDLWVENKTDRSIYNVSIQIDADLVEAAHQISPSVTNLSTERKMSVIVPKERRRYIMFEIVKFHALSESLEERDYNFILKYETEDGHRYSTQIVFNPGNYSNEVLFSESKLVGELKKLNKSIEVLSKKAF